MEEEQLVCKTPSHVMVLRHSRSKNTENDVLGSPVAVRASGNANEGLIGARSALNPRSLNVGVTGLVPSLESKAGRQLRTVKRALGTFKAKMKPSGVSLRRGKGARRHLLDLTISATPRTPEGVFHLLNSPLPLPVDGTPRNARRYRDPAVLTPYTPVDGLRRSERIASRTPTPMKVLPRDHQRQIPRRLESPGGFVNDLNRMTSQLQALTQGVMVFEAMETGLAKSIERQESNGCIGAETEPEKDGPAKKELRGKRTGSLTSLKENLQKRLKKQPSGGEPGKDATAGDKTKEAKSNGTKTTKDSGGQPAKKK